MNYLKWVTEPARSAEQDNDPELAFFREQNVPTAAYESIMGKRSDYLVSIYEGAELDAELSERDGRNRYRNVPMIAIKVKGEKDYVSEALNAGHRQRFPNAVRAWEAMKNAPPRVSAMLLPGITEADLRELEELQLIWLDKLVNATVPDNLKPWQELARRFVTLSKPRMRLVAGQLTEVA